MALIALAIVPQSPPVVGGAMDSHSQLPNAVKVL
jgi:hypothetical protein